MVLLAEVLGDVSPIKYAHLYHSPVLPATVWTLACTDINASLRCRREEPLVGAFGSACVVMAPTKVSAPTFLGVRTARALRAYEKWPWRCLRPSMFRSYTKYWSGKACRFGTSAYKDTFIISADFGRL
jgi:hypothetical protein